MQTRRNFIGIAAKGTAVLAIVPGTLLLEGCDSTAQLVKWGQLVATELEAVQPQLTALGLSTALISKAIVIGKDLVAALKASNNASTLNFLDQLIAPNGLIQQLANDVGVIGDDSARKIVQAALIIAHTTLLLISANIAENAPSNAISLARTAGQGTAANNVKAAADSNKIDRAFRVVFAH